MCWQPLDQANVAHPNPPRPHICGSVTIWANAVPMAASKALPPRASRSAPISAANGCGATTTPRIPVTLPRIKVKVLQPTAPARPSASVILVRDSPSGLESFMVQRHARSPVAPSAYVFPGGTVREDDTTCQVPDAAALAEELSSRSDVPVVEAEAAALYL